MIRAKIFAGTAGGAHQNMAFFLQVLDPPPSAIYNFLQNQNYGDKSLTPRTQKANYLANNSCTSAILGVFPGVYLDTEGPCK